MEEDRDVKTLIDSLPGIELPVEEIDRQLRLLSGGSPGEGGEAPSDFRASQMNVVLHFGIKTPPAEARAQFDKVIRFAQRYPCRIVVLCPESRKQSRGHLRGKLFAQCYIGRNHRSLCYCEALMVGYAPEDSDDLENQVSTWTDNDIPTYHWLHRVPCQRTVEQYGGFMREMKRILYDSSVENESMDCLKGEPELADRVFDLAYARILPIRQQVGQFLSSFPPTHLIAGLKRVEVRHGARCRGEAWQIGAWMRGSLGNCADPRQASIDLETTEDHRLNGAVLKCRWSYRNRGKFLSLQIDHSDGQLEIEAKLTGKTRKRSLRFQPLRADQVIGEAIFF